MSDSFRARFLAALAVSCLAILAAPLAAAQQLSIGNVSMIEPDAGTAQMTFTIHLSAPSATVVRVDVATANGTAIAGSDYLATASTGLRIPAGSTSKTVTVPIIGDTAVESEEYFFVNLSNPVGATPTPRRSARSPTTTLFHRRRCRSPTLRSPRAIPAASRWSSPSPCRRRRRAR